MSFKVGAVTIALEAQTKKFEKQIEQSQKLLERMSRSAQRSAQAIGDVAGKGFNRLEGSVRNFTKSTGKNLLGFFGNVINKAKELTFAMGVGLVGAFAAVSGYGLKMGDSIQQTAIAFDTMLGDADKRRKLMADITEFAKTTPFERFELIDSSKLLLAMGVSSDKIIPSMQMLGDISAGVSANVKDVAFVFGQVRAQGQAYTQDLNQFASRGIPVYEELAKVLGVSVRELREGMASKEIAVTFDDLNTAFQNLTKEGGKFNNLMERQSRSLGGILSNLKDGFDNLVLTFMGITEEGDVKEGSFFDLATQKAQGFQNWLAANEETIGRWGERTFGMIASGIDRAWSDMIAPVLRDFRDWFTSGGKEAIQEFLRTTWSRLEGAFNHFTQTLWPTIQPVLEDFANYMGSTQFQEDLVKIANLIGDIADALSKVAEAAVISKQEMDKITNEEGSMLNPINQIKHGYNSWDRFLNRNRANGGLVDGRRIYEVGENNQPEILYMNKRTYMIPGNDGKVFNRNQMKELAKAQGNTTNNSRQVVINQYGSNLDTAFLSSTLLTV